MEKNLVKNYKLLVVGCSIFLVLVFSAYFYSMAVDQNRRAIKELSDKTAPDPERIMVLSNQIYNNAYKKMWFVSFLIFSSAFLIIQIMPENRQTEK